MIDIPSFERLDKFLRPELKAWGMTSSKDLAPAGTVLLFPNRAWADDMYISPTCKLETTTVCRWYGSKH